MYEVYRAFGTYSRFVLISGILPMKIILYLEKDIRDNSVKVLPI